MGEAATAPLRTAAPASSGLLSGNGPLPTGGGWQLAFEHSPIGGALLDLQGTVLLGNDRLAQMLQRPMDGPGGLCGTDVNEFVSPADRDVDAVLWRELVSGVRWSYDIEKRLVTADGEVLWAQLSLAAIPDEEGSVRVVMAQVQDVTQRREAQLQLADRALNDGLTGLPNRFLTRQWIERALAEQDADRVGVLFCDLDRFKRVNDSLGHLSGDELLAEVASRLRGALRPEDLVGRVGGDEFVIVCEGVEGPEDLLAVAARLSAAFDEPVRLGAHLHTVTLSLGASVGKPGDDADDILMRADMALLRAKRNGRNCVELFDPIADQVVTPGDLALEQQLRSSVADGQLRAYYQPIVSLLDRSVMGYEALLRWEHSDQGLLLPERFLNVAESTGLIRPIGNWVLGQATRDAATSLPPNAWIGVNASPIQLARGGFVDSVVRALALSGLPASRLHLEVTETTLLQASPSVVEDVAALAAMGVSIVLDDFGTGYSSLSLLRDLPVRVVKIDRSFVAPILTDPSALAIVRAVLGMCRDMGLETVAEGVEKEEQAAALAELGCTHGQGWLFGRPTDLARIGEAGGS